MALSERAGSLRCLILSVSLSSGWIEIVGQGGRTHFAGLSGPKCQYEMVRNEKFGQGLAEVSHTTVDELGGQR